MNSARRWYFVVGVCFLVACASRTPIEPAPVPHPDLSGYVGHEVALTLRGARDLPEGTVLHGRLLRIDGDAALVRARSVGDPEYLMRRYSRLMNLGKLQAAEGGPFNFTIRLADIVAVASP